MTTNGLSPDDLRAIAHQTMLDAGFAPDIPPEVVGEVQGFIDFERET